MSDKSSHQGGHHHHKHHKHHHHHHHHHGDSDKVNWESVILGNGPVAHFHGSPSRTLELTRKHSLLESTFLKATAPIRALFNLKQTYKNFKSQDGYDEAAQVFGQLFPGIGQPIATASALSVFAPLVVFGFFGMLDEYSHAKEELDDILHHRFHTNEKLVKLAKHHDKWNSILKDKLGLDVPQSTSAPILEQQEKLPVEQFAYQLAAHRTQEQKKLIASIGKKWGWLGIPGMGGMAAGMGAAIAEASIEIKHFGDKAAVATSLDALSISASSLFLVGQAAMFCYAHQRELQGKKTNKQLKARSNTLEQQLAWFIEKGVINPQTVKHIDEIISYQQKYIKGHAVEYGQMTKLGQALMMTGTASSLGGVTITATLPIIAIGAAFTLGPALSRIHYTVNEKRFRGSSNVLNAFKLNYVKNIVKPYHPFKLVLKAAAEGNYTEPLKEVDNAFSEASHKLALMKALSLIHSANHSHSSAEEKWEKLEHKLDRFFKRSKKGLLQRTLQRKDKEVYEDIEASISEEVKLIIHNHKEDILQLYQQNQTDTSIVLLKTAAHYLNTDATRIKPFAECLHALPEIAQPDAEQLAHVKISLEGKLPLNSLSAGKMDVRKFTRKALARCKQTMKAIRFQLADSITTVSLSMQVKEELTKHGADASWAEKVSDRDQNPQQSK